MSDIDSVCLPTRPTCSWWRFDSSSQHNVWREVYGNPINYPDASAHPNGTVKISVLNTGLIAVHMCYSRPEDTEEVEGKGVSPVHSDHIRLIFTS